MQSKNKNVRFQLPQRYKRYCVFKRHLRGTRRPEVFPFGEGNGETKILRGKITNASKREFKWQERVSPALCARDYKKPKIVQLNKPVHSNDRVYAEKGLSPTLNAMQGGNRQPFIQSKPHWFNKGGEREFPNVRESAVHNELVVRPVITPDKINKRQNGRRMKNDGEPSFTLTAQDRHGVMIDTQIRRLTPTECEKLQGFPSGWTAEGVNEKGEIVKISNSQRYKMAGNAVTTNVVKEIMKKLL